MRSSAGWHVGRGAGPCGLPAISRGLGRGSATLGQGAGRHALVGDGDEDVAGAVGLLAVGQGEHVGGQLMKAPVVGERAVSAQDAELAVDDATDLHASQAAGGAHRSHAPGRASGGVGYALVQEDGLIGHRLAQAFVGLERHARGVADRIAGQQPACRHRCRGDQQRPEDGEGEHPMSACSKAATVRSARGVGSALELVAELLERLQWLVHGSSRAVRGRGSRPAASARSPRDTRARAVASVIPSERATSS